MSDTITLDIHYTTKIYYRPETDEEGLVVKTQFKPIRYKHFEPFEIQKDIPKGDVVYINGSKFLYLIG